MQEEEEEGFAVDQKLELVEFNYRPCSIHPEQRRRIELESKKREEKDSLLDNYFRERFAKSVMNREQKSVVFNNLNKQVGIQENTMEFEADFESANLEIVVRKKFLEYELYMKPDTNTSSNFQWFYFKVKSFKGPKRVTFTIKNFVKSSMLYTSGLKPFYKSSKQNKDFLQLNSEVSFFELQGQKFYSLKFYYQFTVETQQVFFASQPPYTYSMLNQRLLKLKADKLTLTKSLLGKKVPYLIYNDSIQAKVIGIVLARQHPGETVGSWVMQGFMDQLDQRVIPEVMWVIIPMFNIDGVFMGNNRTGLIGEDYNRNWNFEQIVKKQKTLPEHSAFFTLMKNLRRKYAKKIKFFLDFHGHSSQQNVFSYGPPHEQNSQFYYTSKIFPELINKKNNNFCLEQCSASIKVDKKNTARSFMLNYFNIPYSYTIQTTFGVMRDRNVEVGDFLEMGHNIAEVSTEFILNFIIKDKNNQSAQKMLELVKKKYEGKVNDVEQFDSISQKSFDEKPNLLQVVVDKPIKVETRYNNKRYIRQRNIAEAFQKSLNVRQSTLSNSNDNRINESTISHRKKIQNKRVATEIQFPKSMNQKKFKLPRLNNQKNRSSIVNQIAIKNKKQEVSTDGFLIHEKKQQNNPTLELQILNFDQVQKKIKTLHHSRIGKKILIISSNKI